MTQIQKMCSHYTRQQGAKHGHRSEWHHRENNNDNIRGRFEVGCKTPLEDDLKGGPGPVMRVALSELPEALVDVGQTVSQ